MYQLSSFRLIASELIMACLFIVSAQVMMLAYGTWATDMPRSKKICKATRGLYIHMNWNMHHRILVYVPQTYHHITTWPCTRTTPYSRTHTYMYTDTHNMNTAQIHHHNFTYQNITWRIISSRHMQPESVYLRLHTFTLLPPNLTSHENNITSHPHTHTYNMCMHITYITNCLFHPIHISLTHCQSDTPVHAHTYIHTHTQTHPPSPLHHSHTSSSLVAFLCLD